jgi:iron complex outermembrane receptor protein
LIDNQQATTYGDYLKNDPSASVGNVPTGFVNLRGFAVGTDGYLFDGLPGALGLSDGRYQLEGVDHIDVLKGPAAFLYGLGTANSVGGVLNFVPKKPTDVAVRSVDVEATSRALWSADADLGNRFGPDRQFGWRLNVGVKAGEPAVPDSDWAHRAATLALEARFSPAFTLSGGFEYAYNHFRSLQPYFVLPPGIQVPAAPNLSRSLALPWDRFNVIGTTAYVRADWQLSSDWSLRAQALHGNDDEPRVKGAHGGMIDSASGDITLFGSEAAFAMTATTAQLSLNGQFATGTSVHRLTVSATSTQGDQRSGSANLGTGFDSNLYVPVDSPEPADVPLQETLTQKTRDTSVMVGDWVQLGGGWSALGGVRHARLGFDNFNPDGSPSSANDVSKSAPFGGLIWKPTGQSSIYANFAEGLEQGSRAPAGTTNANQLLPPIVSRQLEFGAKLDLIGLSITAAAFDLRRPFEIVDPVSLTFVQQGNEQHRGLEFNATGSATRNVSMVAGMLWLDPRLHHTGDPATEGRVAVGVSRTTANLYLDDRIGTVPGLFVNGGVYFSGAQYADAANTQRVSGWTRVDIGGRYETRSGPVRTTLYVSVENATNRNYWAGAQTGILTLADPRTFKVTCRFAL